MANFDIFRFVVEDWMYCRLVNGFRIRCRLKTGTGTTRTVNPMTITGGHE
jgi:hypothetical protein